MYIKDYDYWYPYENTHYTTSYSYWRPAPTKQDFTLDVISHHPEFENKTLRKYNLDGIDTIGVYGDERFTVRFSNNSNEDVQVRLSLDGTDCYTGKLADLEINHDMFVVRAGRTLNLKAWRETNNGGAAFVFASGDKSVSLHTHGDVSHKGIIAAAVFVEQERVITTTTSGVRRERSLFPKYTTYTTPKYITPKHTMGGSLGSSGGMTHTSNSPMPAAASGGMSVNSFDEAVNTVMSEAAEIKTSAAVGAGEYVEQKLTTVQGLNKPVLNTVVRVRYLWWDSLVEKLKTQQPRDTFQSGFPGAKSFADLSNVPRVQSAGSQQPKRTNMFETQTVIDSKMTFARTL
jgi:hypothetical protein